jgi:hypothetical protein
MGNTGDMTYNESLTLYVPVAMEHLLSPEERVQLQNYAHTAAINATQKWLEENFPPEGGRTVDLSELISEEKAREIFNSESRTQSILSEIYRGGTRTEIIRRVKKLRIFAGEENFIPNYVSHTMNRLRKDQRIIR